MADAFGDFSVPSQVEEAVLLTLNIWFPTYLRVIEEHLGLASGFAKDPVKYNNRNRFTASKGEQLPRVVVISPGLIGQPVQHGRTYDATWNIGVGIAMAAQDEEEINKLAKIYATAAKLIVLQKRGLGTDGETPPFIKGIKWTGESYDDLPIDHQTLLYKAASVYFAIEVQNVISLTTGPDVPDLPVYPSYGQVPDTDHIFVDVEVEDLNDN